MKFFEVTVQKDLDTGTWYVSESDVPGLNAEAKSLDEMQEELMRLVPELLQLNGLIDLPDPHRQQVPWELVSRFKQPCTAVD